MESTSLGSQLSIEHGVSKQDPAPHANIIKSTADHTQLLNLTFNKHLMHMCTHLHTVETDVLQTDINQT
jgi:hypothetical protein